MATLEKSSSIEQSEGGGVRDRLRMDVDGAKDAMAGGCFFDNATVIRYVVGR